MIDLFTESGAVFDETRNYRYTLWRKWSDGPTLAAICCNPSTADETINDRTVSGMIRRAHNWGYGQFVMLNLFAWRSTDPKVLRGLLDPIGRDNDLHIAEQAKKASMVICAWGSCTPLAADRAINVRRMLRDSGIKAHHLKMGKTGQPCHPLYLPMALEPVEYLDM